MEDSSFDSEIDRRDIHVPWNREEQFRKLTTNGSAESQRRRSALDQKLSKVELAGRGMAVQKVLKRAIVMPSERLMEMKRLRCDA